MIPRRFINEWREQAPWQTDAMVEQDLIISRAIVEIFNDPYLSKNLAFRGGTALNKLYFNPATRYSEDIDLVQTRSEPIGKIFDCFHHVLDPWLGIPKRTLKEGRATLYYRYPLEGASDIRMRLKIEINTREHFTALNPVLSPYAVDTAWFSGSATVNSFDFNELIGTKLRALYQRSKGRDLYDVWLSTQYEEFKVALVLKVFEGYLKFNNMKVSRAEFEENLEGKLKNHVFTQGTSKNKKFCIKTRRTGFEERSLYVINEHRRNQRNTVLMQKSNF